ncbi:MAG: hypothetical protein JW808_06720, partial [Victivallales bacterium]|nr:hypothetical protein [Victivallales bacterium]
IMLQDKERRGALEKHFPEGSEVVFYVRRHKADADVEKNAIAVGNCASPIASRTIASVPGCRAEIRPSYVFKHIIEQLDKIKK